MGDVHDVAAAVLARTGSISTFKLQKLVYYCQAWHLAWDEEPLFDNRIEAWANGPVCRDLYDRHRGSFTISFWPYGEEGNLSLPEMETVDAVVRAYGHLNGQRLSQLTHAENPWRDARLGLRPGDRGNAVITPESMADYYGSIGSADNSVDVEDIASLPDDPF